MYQNLLYEVRQGVAFVTVNRPSALNALDRKTISELGVAFQAVSDDDTVRAVILTGSGNRSFAAGADVRELANQSAAEGRDFSIAGQEVFSFIEQIPKPVIAAVNGYALGGGCELALACTLRVASENAVFGQPEVKLGIIPGYGGSQRLPRLVGKGRASEMLLTGDPISAEEAYRIGLVNRVVPQAELGPVVESLVERILANAPLALRLCLQAIGRGLEMSLTDGQALEAELFGQCLATEDMREGTQAFLEKRAPEFKGE
jgi:enoyl-CoA hydratase